jgi:LPXTG-motif cell wall-anchored protein
MDYNTHLPYTGTTIGVTDYVVAGLILIAIGIAMLLARRATA